MASRLPMPAGDFADSARGESGGDKAKKRCRAIPARLQDTACADKADRFGDSKEHNRKKRACHHIIPLRRIRLPPRDGSCALFLSKMFSKKIQGLPYAARQIADFFLSLVQKNRNDNIPALRRRAM